MSTGIKAIAAERQRQIDKEGWSPERDDNYESGELGKAASAYAWMGAQTDILRDAFRSTPPPVWPMSWDLKWWKPKDRRRDLVKAGALIAAEIDRLDRLNPANPKETT